MWQRWSDLIYSKDAYAEWLNLIYFIPAIAFYLSADRQSLEGIKASKDIAMMERTNADRVLTKGEEKHRGVWDDVGRITAVHMCGEQYGLFVGQDGHRLIARFAA
jgi:hypothetical protein